jgi:hypothetical protein
MRDPMRSLDLLVASKLICTLIEAGFIIYGCNGQLLPHGNSTSADDILSFLHVVHLAEQDTLYCRRYENGSIYHTTVTLLYVGHSPYYGMVYDYSLPIGVVLEPVRAYIKEIAAISSGCAADAREVVLPANPLSMGAGDGISDAMRSRFYVKTPTTTEEN